MKVLHYNWVDYLDDESRGGGVSVYLRNLIREMEEMDVNFLSSGISYDLLRRAPRWEPVRHGPREDRQRRYEIVNAGVLAPAHHAFGMPGQLGHPETEKVVFDFIEATGPYDVIHFHNLEGVPVDVLRLKARWPQTRVVLSLHNYYPICPQVNLWYREAAVCTDFEGGARCVDCLLHRHDPRHLRLANGIAYHLKTAGIRPGSTAFDVLFRQTMRVGSRTVRALGWARRRLRPLPPPAKGIAAAAAPASAPAFAARRQRMISEINANCDVVLCVSDRTREIARSYGIAAQILQTSYIGTQQAEHYARTAPRPVPRSPDASLTLGYLGYMRRDKGFFFLLDALEALPPALARQLHLVVAAHSGPSEAMTQLARLRSHLGQVTHQEGYTHAGLDGLLADVDIGLVPVLWEDNLPQVAIEMHARHIPLLTSDMGGAQELAGVGSLRFRAGDVADFTSRIEAILAGDVDFDLYWQNARSPQTMPGHLEELVSLYSGKTGGD